MDNKDGVIWMDGTFIPWRDAKIHVLTHTLHYSMGVFEGLRAYSTEKGPAIFRLQEHTDRLFDSAQILNIKLPFDKAAINQACLDAVDKNRLKAAYIRPICFYGSEDMGLRADKLKVHVIVAAWSWDSYLGNENMQKGIRIKTSSYTRHHVNITMCKAKATGNYINSMLALREAIECGYDEALLLDNEGYVAECSGENIFIIRNGIMLTPDPTSALPGITRDTLFYMAKEKGIRIHEKRITRDEIYIADEVFLCGTAAEIVPVCEMDGRIINQGVPGEITKELQTSYFDLVHGHYPCPQGWLSYIQSDNT